MTFFFFPRPLLPRGAHHDPTAFIYPSRLEFLEKYIRTRDTVTNVNDILISKTIPTEMHSIKFQENFIAQSKSVDSILISFLPLWQRKIIRLSIFFCYPLFFRPEEFTRLIMSMINGRETIFYYGKKGKNDKPGGEREREREEKLKTCSTT